jgi:exosortase A-associated hydrolase 2
VHAFAEEMNKSRRMAAVQGRALAQSGFDVLQIDLLGCGDSSGDFSDATWQDWLEDVRLGTQALAARSEAPQWLWGHRLGCLLACALAHESHQPARLLLWQPVISGRQFLNQFLRIKLLTQPDAAGSDRMNTSALRTMLAAGEPVEVGGYILSPRLFQGLDQAVLEAPPAGSEVHWLDVVHDADAPTLASVSQTCQAWLQHGIAVTRRAVVGPAFWQTQEITQCESLIAHTLEAVCT